MNLLPHAMPICLMTALVLAPMPLCAQTNPQVFPVKAALHIGFSGQFSWGHVAISPDGKFVVSARWSEVKLWDLATGRLLRTMNGHTGEVKAVMFSPDSKRMLSGSRDKSVKLWDLATGQTIRAFEGHADAVNAIAFSADGNRILSASDDKTIKLWDVATGQLLRTFTGHSGKVSSVAFSPDGSRVLSGSDDHTGRLWDVATGQLFRTFAAFKDSNTNSATAVAFLPDGARVVLGGDRVTLWDAASGELLRTFEPNIPDTQQFFASADSLAVSSDGTRIMARVQLARKLASGQCFSTTCPLPGSTVKADRATIAWDATTGRQLRLRVLDAWNPSPAISGDGTRLLTESQLEDTLTGQVVRKFENLQELSSAMVALAPNGERALVGGPRRTSIWSISTGQLLSTIEYPADKKLSVVFSQDGDRVLAITTNYKNPDFRSVLAWDAATGKLLKSVTIDSDRSDAAVFSPDRSSVFLGADKFVGLWDWSTGTLVRKFASSGYVRFVAVSPDGARVAIASDSIAVWDTATGQLLREIRRGRINALAFSLDGTKLISAETSESMQVWDLITGQSLLDVAKPVLTAEFSPDGKHIFARYYPHTMKLWDLTTKQVVRSVEIPAIDEVAAAFTISADATRFLLSTDYGAAFGRVKTGELLATLAASQNGEWVAFSPEGYFDGSKNAAGMFTVVRGLDMIDRAQVEKTLRRPELLRQKLKGSPVARP